MGAANAGKDAIAAQASTTATTSPDSNATAAPIQVFLRAVVVEVLYDLTAYPEEDFEELKSLCDSPDLVGTAPRNSLIVRVITGGADKKAPDATEEPTEEQQEEAETNDEVLEEGEKLGEVGTLCFPFFPPHLCFPIKPGEQVWVVKDAVDVASKILYWMCRIPEVDHVDDINFTHADRKFVGDLAPKTSKEKADDAEDNQSESSSEERNDSSENPDGSAAGEQVLRDADGDGIDDLLFGFPNGPGEEGSYTLKEKKAYEEIVNISTAYAQFRRQHVPRFTKKPGDFVLQGSHNTLICLGQDRGWGAYFDGVLDEPWDAEHSNATETEGQLKNRKDYVWGSIDIVAGRGRYDYKFTDETTEVPPTLTAPRCIKNTPMFEVDGGRESWVEINKNPQGNDEAEVNRLDAPAEGDPDFAYDAARLVVAQGSAVDANFNIDRPGETIPTAIGEPAEALTMVTKDYPSSVVAKADEIRLIARKLDTDKPTSGAPEINGSIRIVKEGLPDEDLAAILLLADGTIQISGSRIFLGRHPDDGGLGEDNSGPADGSSQPYVKYQQLEDLLTALCNNVQSFCDTVLGHVTPGSGAPSPQLNSAAATLKADMGSRKGEIPDLASERIFGE